MTIYKAIALSFLIVVVACAPASHDMPGAQPTIRRVLPIEVTYSWIQKNIFAPKCMDCHSANQGDGDGLKKANFDSYNSTMKVVMPLNPMLSSLYTSIADHSMPKNGNPLSDHDMEVILD